MAYLTVAELKTYYLEQLNETAKHDGAIQHFLNAAEARINKLLGFSFSTPVSGAQIIYGDGTVWLTPPTYTGVPVVTAPSGYTVPTFEEVDGSLVIADSSGVLAYPYLPSLAYDGWITQVWQNRVPYTVTADFGEGDVPDDLKDVCGQIAVRLFMSRDSGGSEVAGVEGATSIQVRHGLTPEQIAVIESYKQTHGFSVGVW